MRAESLEVGKPEDSQWPQEDDGRVSTHCNNVGQKADAYNDKVESAHNRRSCEVR